MEQSDDLVSNCFQKAVEELLPGHGGDFELRIRDWGGAYGESDHGAKNDLVYIAYNKYKTVTAEGGLDGGRGVVNVPWGHKMTHIGAQQECAEINASFAVIVEKLGLRAIGDPGLKLITNASGGGADLWACIKLDHPFHTSIDRIFSLSVPPRHGRHEVVEEARQLVVRSVPPLHELYLGAGLLHLLGPPRRIVQRVVHALEHPDWKGRGRGREEWVRRKGLVRRKGGLRPAMAHRLPGTP